MAQTPFNDVILRNNGSNQLYAPDGTNLGSLYARNLGYPSVRRNRRAIIGDSRASQFHTQMGSANTGAGSMVVTTGGGVGGWQGTNTATVNCSTSYSGGPIKSGVGMWVQLQANSGNPGGTAGIPYNYATQVLSKTTGGAFTCSTSLPPGDYSGNSWQILELGFKCTNATAFWIDAYAQQPTVCVANYAIGGTVSSFLQTTLASVLAGPAFDIIDVLTGINDIHSTTTLPAAYTAAQGALANITSFATSILEAKSAIVRIHIPAGATTATNNWASYGAFWMQALADLRRGLIAFALKTPGVILIDSFANTIAASGAMQTTYSIAATTDGIHPQPIAGQADGKIAFNNFTSIQQNRPWDVPVCLLDDGLNNTQTGVAYPNILGTFSGTTGTLTNGSGGGTLSGTAPTGWTINGGSAGATATCTANQAPLVPSTEVSNAANFGQATEISVSTTAAVGNMWMISPDIHTKIAAGNWYRVSFTLYFKAAPVNMHNIRVQTFSAGDNDFGGGYQIDASSLATAANGAATMQFVSGDKVTLSCEFYANSNTYTSFNIYLYFQFYATAGTLDVQIQTPRCQVIDNPWAISPVDALAP